MAFGGVEPDTVAGVGLHQSQGVRRFEGAEGGARVVGEQAVAGALGEAVVGQEAIHGAIRDALDPGAEFGVGSDELAQLRDASGGQFVDQRQQLGTQRRIVDPR